MQSGYWLRAVGAAFCCQRNVAEAFGAGLGCGLGDGLGLLDARHELIDGYHEHEIHDTGDDQKLDDVVEEIADHDLAAANGKDDVTEVGLANGGADEGIDDVSHKRANNLTEGAADNDGDGEVHHISTQNKIPKSFKHSILQRSLN